MIIAVKKIHILRYCLIIFLFSVLLISAEYLYLHYQKARSLQSNIESVINSREQSTLIDSCIYRLYSADNNSRLYTITRDKLFLDKYLVDVNEVVHFLNKIKFDEKAISNSSSEKFRALLKLKTAKTINYIKLRQLTDSLIKSSKHINDDLKKIGTTPTVTTAQHFTIVDTLKNQPVRKKTFLGRIFSGSKKVIPVMINKDTTIYTHTLPAGNINKVKNAYNYYSKISYENNKLKNNELQLLNINNRMLEDIITSLKSYRSIDQLYINNSKAELKINTANVLYDLGQGSAINFVFLILVITLVFYNIWRIFRNEKEMVEYSNSAKQHAQLKSNFLAGMSHEIRTPLNSVIGFSEQLSQENLSSVQKEQVSAIQNSSEMILSLVNEILDFSKYETGSMNFEKNSFMVKQVIEDVYTTMNIQAQKKNLVLENLNQVDENLCCEGDKMRLKQVMMNLISNAIKFTFKGNVIIESSIEHTLPDDILLKVVITDTGLGIDKVDLTHIFDEYSQVAKAQKITKQKGTGLGLAICKKIIELQGGKIEVTSTPGKGSVFSFDLPLKKLEFITYVKEPTISLEVMTDMVKDKHVLLAEDNQLNVLLITTILKKWNIKYDVCYNGHDAFELFKKNNYDMVLTDIEMPAMNGLQLTQSIRNYPLSEKSNITIMALTANVLEDDQRNYFNAGMNGVIHKPFLEKELIGNIALTLQTRLSESSFMA